MKKEAIGNRLVLYGVYVLTFGMAYLFKVVIQAAVRDGLLEASEEEKK